MKSRPTPRSLTDSEARKASPFRIGPFVVKPHGLKWGLYLHVESSFRARPYELVDTFNSHTDALDAAELLLA